MQCIARVCDFKVRNLIVRCDLKKYHFTMGSCSIPGSTYSWYQIKRRGEISVGAGLVEAKCYKRRGQIKRRGGSWRGKMLEA